MAKDLEQVVAAFVQEHGLSGKTLVMAVSGGSDSVCLLHLFCGLKSRMDLNLHVAHLDHGLRGVESQADAQYVTALAKQMGLPVTTGKADVQAFRRASKLSLEEAAREVRYHFLSETAANQDTDLVVTGHTADDQIETILLHIIRGSGTHGLIGLKAMTPWTMNGKNIIVARPLLAVSRQETQQYCYEHQLNPREDATNLSLSPLRNRVRLQLVPLLEGYNPAIRDAVGRASAVAVDEQDYLDEQVRLLLPDIGGSCDKVINLKRDALSTLHKAIQRHLLRSCIKDLLGTLKDIENRHIDDMLSLLSSPSGRQIDLPYGLVFRVDYQSCWLGFPDDIPCPYPLLEGEYPLAVPGINTLPGWRVKADISQGWNKMAEDNLTAYFDADRVGSELSVRTRRRGDRFTPLGMESQKKVGQFMIDAKVPRHWRKRIPLVMAGEYIIWLTGCRMANDYRVTEQTRRILKLEFKPL